MKIYLLTILLAFSAPITAQDETKEDCEHKTSMLRTGLGLSCLLASIFTAIKTKDEFNKFEIKMALKNNPINIIIQAKEESNFQKFGNFFGDLFNSPKKPHIEPKLSNDRELIKYCIESACPTLAYGSATIALATLGTVNVIKGLGLSKSEIYQKYKQFLKK